MSSRARYPPPGMGGGMNPNPFQPRNPTQNYTTRGPTPNNMNHQTFHNPQQQQWLRRTQLPPSDSTADEVEKTVQSEAVDSSPQDWKAGLKLPPADTRYKTEVKSSMTCLSMCCSLHFIFWDIFNYCC
ncbi:DEAD-box ATP-dependent RNA helicase 8-like [Olea europaea var. sylvestris]|uniref:DEAD-box ATP-dependent RNA helicase 8-like n=1 Tax=Olea europaea var. sylvestris TaxID=158386 RepID=UPI000C1CEF43|nr:DEAD-box ATP-dependent RNA helicase 8-like [Olea europaea var. sylvestris]